MATQVAGIVALVLMVFVPALNTFVVADPKSLVHERQLPK
jgi:hypothetical protein